MQLSARGVTLEVEDHGPVGGEPLLMVMGLGMQLVAWQDGFVAALVRQGFRVIRFDNRDIGLSQRFDHLGVPHLVLDALKFGIGLPVRSPYSLADLADDSAGLLDALGIPRAHVCGASMGGMVAQHLAARHPQRVKSLTLMMTTSGSRRLPGPSFKVQAAMLSRPRSPGDEASLVEHYVKLYQLIGSPAYPNDPAELTARVTAVVRRSHRPQAVARQLVAIAADGDRSPLLASLALPVQVIHGLADPLVPVAAAHDLKRRIAGAELDVIDGMGHDLPAALWPRFAAGIAEAAGRA